MAMSIQWAGYYSIHPHTRVCTKCRTQARILVGNNFSALPIPYGHLSAHTRTHYPHFSHEKII